MEIQLVGVQYRKLHLNTCKIPLQNAKRAIGKALSKTTKLRALSGICFLLSQSPLVHADEPILKVFLPDAQTPIAIEREELLDLPQQCFMSNTEWVPSPHEYCGPTYAAIKARWNLPDGEIDAEALNRYSARIPTSRLIETQAIFALTSDGEALTARDKGPIWIMFDAQKYPESLSETYRFYWVWQLENLHFLTE